MLFLRTDIRKYHLRAWSDSLALRTVLKVLPDNLRKDLNEYFDVDKGMLMLDTLVINRFKQPDISGKIKIKMGSQHARSESNFRLFL